MTCTTASLLQIKNAQSNLTRKLRASEPASPIGLQHMQNIRNW